MHPRTQEVLEYLDTSRRALEQAVAAVPEAYRATRPAAERWSVADVVGHLALVEARITGLLAAEIERARAAGLGAEQESTPVVAGSDVARVTDRSRPIVAGEATIPPEGIDASAACADLAATRKGLRELVTSADGLALGTVVLPHRIFGPLNVYQWLTFIGAHEARHTAQVLEIGNEVGASSA